MKNQLTLPYNDFDQVTRRSDLSRMKTEYEVIFHNDIPMTKELRKRDESPFEWKALVIKALVKNRRNTEGYLAKTNRKFENTIPKLPPLKLAQMIAGGDFVNLVNYFIPNMGNAVPNGKVKNIKEYSELFSTFSLPSLAQFYLEDRMFGRSFVAGANPAIIKIFEDLDALDFGDEKLNSIPGFAKDSLRDMVDEKRLYYVDYSFASEFTPGEHRGEAKQIYNPAVWLAVPKNSRDLLPIAIRESFDSGPVFFPTDGYTWAIAKAAVRAIDGTYQETVSHLGETHLILEAVTIGARRCLHGTHPIMALLEEHLEGTMPINSLAVKKLIQPGQAVDFLVSAEMNSVFEQIMKSRSQFNFKDQALPRDLKLRGVDSLEGLPEYPYRDDGLLVWEEILKFTTSYINYWYSSDSAVLKDHELSSFIAFVGSDQLGKVNGFGDDLKTRSDLALLVSTIIYIASAKHAAVNFAQLTDLTYVPIGNMSAFMPFPEKVGHTEQDFLRMLPPIEIALKTVQSLHFLGDVIYNTIGNYKINRFFYDLRIYFMIFNFKAGLAQAEAKINLRNTKRWIPYIHMKPSRIPASTNI